MSDVDRWYPNAYGEMQDYPTGEYVLASDYDALRARLAEAERERDTWIARAVALFPFVKDGTLCGELQSVAEEYHRWKRATDNGDATHG